MIERRALATEVRAQGRRLTGYAARFNTPTEISGITERIAVGAFRSTLAAKGDVLALVDHNIEKLLARTASGTLRLSEDQRGLAFDLDLAPTSLANDVLVMVERGDINAMSFGFRPITDHWADQRTRELRSVELVEISVLSSFAAYPNTSVTARALIHDRNYFLSPAQRRRWLETI